MASSTRPRAGIVTLIAADTTWQRMLLLNHRTAPQLPVVYAVRMSMSVPLLWEEVVWRSEWGPYYTWDPKSRPTDAERHDRPRDRRRRAALELPDRALHGIAPDVAAVVGAAKTKNVLGLLIDETLPVPNRPARPATSAGLCRLARRPDASSGGYRSLRTRATCAHDNMAKAVFAANVVRLPAGGYATTQFDMTDAEREALVDAGRSAMRQFLSAPDRARRRGRRARPVDQPGDPGRGKRGSRDHPAVGAGLSARNTSGAAAPEVLWPGAIIPATLRTHPQQPG